MNIVEGFSTRRAEILFFTNGSRGCGDRRNTNAFTICYTRSSRDSVEDNDLFFFYHGSPLITGQKITGPRLTIVNPLLLHLGRYLIFFFLLIFF